MCVFYLQQLQATSPNYISVVCTSMTFKVPGRAKPIGPEQQWRLERILGRQAGAQQRGGPHQACACPAILQLPLALDGAHDARTVSRLPPALVRLQDTGTLSRGQCCQLSSCRSKGAAEAA